MAASVGSAVRVTTGLLSANGGINSGVVPTIAGQSNPDGLKPNNLAFANNATVRDSGISPRPGWIYLTTMPTGLSVYQGGGVFEPPGEFPYLILQIGGHTYRVRVDTDNSIDDISIPGDYNDPLLPQAWLVQGEQFEVIQDGVANPLFWDGATMRRSLGDSTVVGVTSLLEIIGAIGNQNFMNVNVLIPPGYTGLQNAILNIGGNLYRQVVAANGVALTNNDDPSIGLTIAAGTLVYDGTGNQIGTVLAETTIPAIAGTQNTFAAYTVPLPSNVVINGYSYTVALSAAPFVDNPIFVRVINLNAPAGNIAVGTAIETVPELPPAEAMDYYMGRIWLAKGRQYIAGDIVRGPSGTAQYDYTDSILKNTENVYISGGGAFTVPTMDGNIRALKHPANLNTALGQGQLLPMTRRVIYSTNIVPERAAWAALSEPLQRVAQINFGTVSDRSCVSVNGDLFYQSPDGVRSLQQSIRQFDVQWGDVPLSNEEIRVISRNDRSLLRFATGVEFNNRLLQSALPFQTPVGVAHPGLMPLNFDLLNSMNNKLPPVWEGLWEGLNVLQMFKGDFGGRQRAFAAVWSEIHQAIEVWELSTDALEDVGKEASNRITWSFESPSYTWGDPMSLKQLDSMKIWVDRLISKVDFTVEFRPSNFPCWLMWHRWSECAAKNECENLNPPIPCDHPQQEYLPQYRIPMTLPTPPTTCNAIVNRPVNIDYQFQVRVTIKGSCRVRGFLLFAIPREEQPYMGITC